MSSFYSVIPSNVIFSTELKPNEKILYGVLVSLANEQGEIVLTNQEIANLYVGHGHDCSTRAVSGWVNAITRMGLFVPEIRGNNTRVLKIAHSPILPVPRPNTGRTGGNEYRQEILDVMEYYTQVFGKTPKLNNTVLTNMKNHFKNGYTVIDFQKVIAVKSVDPYFVENPQYFLPSTLFKPSNFTKYINQYDMQVETSIDPTTGDKPTLSDKEF